MPSRTRSEVMLYELIRDCIHVPLEYGGEADQASWDAVVAIRAAQNIPTSDEDFNEMEDAVRMLHAEVIAEKQRADRYQAEFYRLVEDRRRLLHILRELRSKLTKAGVADV